ncbi:MAG: collagen-like protein [Bacteroidota bacterium]
MKKYFFLEKTHFLLLFYLVISSILLPGCKDGKNGEPGPKGVSGLQGTPGQQGPQGVISQSRVKTGIISATITGNLSDNTPVNESFKCEFADALFGSRLSIENNRYYFDISRFDSLFIQYINFRFDISTNPNSPDPNFSSGYMSWYKNVTDTQSIRLFANQYSYNSNAVSSVSAQTLTNVVYNSVTGIVSGNFTWKADNKSIDTNGYYNSSTSSKKDLTIQGSFSIPVQQRVFRIAAPE